MIGTIKERGDGLISLSVADREVLVVAARSGRRPPVAKHPWRWLERLRLRKQSQNKTLCDCCKGARSQAVTILMDDFARKVRRAFVHLEGSIAPAITRMQSARD